MSELERALLALGRELEFPSAPDLAGRVRELLEPRGSQARGRLRARTLVLVAAAAAVAALAATLAVPDARSTFLRFLHLGGVTISRVDTLPPAQERPLTDALGQRVPLARIAAQTGIRPRLPRGERPTHGYVLRGVVSFVFRVDGKALLLTEFAGGEGIVEKTATAETTVERVDVAGEPGYWLAGKRHVVVITPTPARLAGNVLLWQRGGVGLRLEGPVSKAEALRIARGVH